MMQLFPLPTPGMPNPTPYLNWIASGANRSDNEQFDIKIDHRFSEKNLFSGKYSQEWSNYTPYNCFKTFIDPCGSGANTGNSHLFALNDVYTFSPTLLLTTTLGFTRGTELIDAYNSSQNPNPLSTLGFPSYLQSNGFNGVPAIFIEAGIFSGLRLYQRRKQSLRQLQAGSGYGSAFGDADQNPWYSRIEVRIRRPFAPAELHSDERSSGLFPV